MKKGHSLPAAVFIAGALGLDVLNSLARPADELVDWWSDGEQFLSWMRQAKLLTDNDIATVRSNISPKKLDRAATKARELREWFRGFVNAHKGKPLTTPSLPKLRLLKDLLEIDEMFWSLEPVPLGSNRAARHASGCCRLRARRRWRNPESLLAPIAEAFADFLCRADFRYVKSCQGRNCILFFLDQTRRHGRRWCSMAVCGNRAKQDAHLARLKKRLLR